MWSDELDKKMRNTTEGSHPAYDERAWNKMEKLLDKHLPQKRRRRFIPLLLIPLALIGTGVFFAIQRQPESGITAEKIKGDQPVISEKEAGSQEEIKGATNTPSPAVVQRTERSELKDAGISTTPYESRIKKQSESAQKRMNDKTVGPQRLDQPREATIDDGNRYTPADQPKDVPEQKVSAPNITTSAPLAAAADKSVPEKTVNKEKKEDIPAQVQDLSKKSPSKTNDSKGSNFAIAVSTGPDFSSVNFNEPGEWRMQYGIGVIYSLSKKISLRTGFYAGRKIYTADPDDYHSNYNPPPSLQKIEANCLVYEIPLNVLYSFPKLKKHSWFVGGGLSSYLMKEETYDYMHKYPSGQVQYHTTEYKNENAHFFSVVNLSGGYQYHFSDRFSLMAEPYVKIPLSGVGQGKVQLNSGGILFTGVVKPFFKKN